MLRGAHLAYDASREGRPPGGMNSVRRDRVAPRLVRLGAGLVVGGTLVAAPEAPAYRLMHDREGAILGGESGAFRWPDEVLSPYRPGWSHPAPSAATIREFGPATGAGPGWQLTIEWIGTLELAVVAPGCEAVTIRCDVTDCSVN